MKILFEIAIREAFLYFLYVEMSDFVFTRSGIG